MNKHESRTRWETEAVDTILSVGSIVAFQSLKYFNEDLTFEPQITEIYTEKTIKQRTLSDILRNKLSSTIKKIKNSSELLQKFNKRNELSSKSLHIPSISNESVYPTVAFRIA